jgi:YidC/Oxa1 family membrane protein insertase
VKKRNKKLTLAAGLTGLVLLLSACGTSEVTSSSTGIWDKIIYFFGVAIQGLSFGNMGIGIIIFTLIIRVILLPLMHFQTKSMRKTQELQPKIKALQAKYPGKDTESRQLLQQETQRLYGENNVNPYIGCLPLVVQMPILMALYQAISRVPELKEGQFLWLHLNSADPYFILPILAAVFTFGSTYLANMSQLEANPTTKIMNIAMPVMILVMAINISSGISLYWAVSNAFQVVQTLLINNPFKIRREREEAAQHEKDRERALQKAMKNKKKRKK